MILYKKPKTYCNYSKYTFYLFSQNNPNIQENNIFGAKLPRDDWNAFDCIRGDASLETNKIEENLGKATRHGFKNETK